jgi:hypothetical protein
MAASQGVVGVLSKNPTRLYSKDLISQCNGNKTDRRNY